MSKATPITPTQSALVDVLADYLVGTTSTETDALALNSALFAVAGDPVLSPYTDLDPEGMLNATRYLASRGIRTADAISAAIDHAATERLGAVVLKDYV